MSDDGFVDAAANAAGVGAHSVEPRSLKAVEREIDRLDKEVALDEPVPMTAPMYKWTPRQRQSYYDFVGSTAQIMQSRIIRPNDPAVVDELRRREAEQHNKTSATSVSLYKTKSANRNYARSGPLNWNDNTKVSFSDASAAGEVEKHTHTLYLTLPLDIRFLRGASHLLYEPFEEAMFLSNPHLPYLCLTFSTRRLVTQLNTHAAAVQFANRLRETRQSMQLGALLRMAKYNYGMSLHAVLFRHDSTIEVMFSLDIDCRWFAIFSFALPVPPVGAQRARQLHEQSVVGRRIRQQTLRELSTNATVTEDTPATLGPEAATYRVQQIVSSIAAKAGAIEESAQIEFYNFVAPSETPSIGAAPDSRDSRLLARCTSLIVYDLKRALSLQNTSVQFAYHYFVPCQCALVRNDLCVYKRAYGVAARSPRDQFVTIDANQRLPHFDSDDEADFVPTATSTTIKTSDERTAEERAQRYTTKRARSEAK